jgi:hypothetical protein
VLGPPFALYELEDPLYGPRTHPPTPPCNLLSYQSASSASTAYANMTTAERDNAWAIAAADRVQRPLLLYLVSACIYALH